MSRATAEAVLTIDAKPAERAAWQALAEKEQRLVRDRERAEKSKRGSITRQINDTRAEMDDYARVIATGQVTVTVQALARGRYRDMLKNHPPREGDTIDKRVGYNGDTFPGVILREATVHATGPDGEVALDLDEWISEDGPINEAEFMRWLSTAINLNTRPVDQSPPLRVS